MQSTNEASFLEPHPSSRHRCHPAPLFCIEISRWRGRHRHLRPIGHQLAEARKIRDGHRRAACVVDIRMPGYPAFLAIVYALTVTRVKPPAAPSFSRRPSWIYQLRPDWRISRAARFTLHGKSPRSPRISHWPLARRTLSFHGQLRRRSLTEVWAIFLTTLASLFLVAVIASAAGVASWGSGL